MKEFGNVLSAESSGTNSVAIRPALITESGKEIANRVIPGAIPEIACAAGRRESLGVKGHARKKSFREKQEQKKNSQRHCRSSTLKRAQYPHHFPLAPGGAPNESES